MGKGWTSLSLKDDLIAQIDAFIAHNDAGFSNRAEVIATALREFLDSGNREEVARALLERTIKAVALTEPKDVPALLKALLAELDARGGHQASTSKGGSKTESTKRQ